MVQIKQLQGKNRNCTCSNPNCRSVFSQPKILKYFICPDCQSLLEIEGIPTQPIIETSQEDELETKGELRSTNLKLSKELEDIKLDLNKKSIETKELKTKNANLSKNLEETKKELTESNKKYAEVKGKLEEKTKKLVFIAEKNLDLINKVELLEVNRYNYKAKHQDFDKKIQNLNNQISEKDQLIKTLNEKVRVVEGELLQVKKEKDSVIGERDSALSRLSVSEDKVNEEVESRVEVQIELTNLKEKMTDLVRREREAKEKNVEYEAEIRDLGLAIKKLETEIQQTKENITLKYDIIKDKILKKPKKQLEFKEKNLEADSLSKKSLNDSHMIKDTSTLKSSEIHSNLTNNKKTHKTPIRKQDIKKSTYTSKFDSKKSKEDLIRRLHEKESDLDSKCNYYLGYLAEREKDETIPTICIECPKSIDCMLKKVHKSNKSVKEIKKWYRFR